MKNRLVGTITRRVGGARGSTPPPAPAAPPEPQRRGAEPPRFIQTPPAVAARALGMVPELINFCYDSSRVVCPSSVQQPASGRPGPPSAAGRGRAPRSRPRGLRLRGLTTTKYNL
ncbi:hypothetical protein EVAR_95083_1 [Eumeta japonica]|uniref:Uncharacterized protein n=1 Tax=Eumeta variegata TaxID=151549 RepID=A0A4C1W6D0_EUMVA|nr:hypothetical protein EVAR_95083_1 [Eumeta japonica]